MPEVSVYDARNNLSRLIKQAQAGDEVVITSRGKPVARLVPARRALTGPELVEWLDAHRVNPARRRTRQEIDADLAAERESWD